MVASPIYTQKNLRKLAQDLRFPVDNNKLDAVHSVPLLSSSTSPVVSARPPFSTKSAPGTNQPYPPTLSTTPRFYLSPRQKHSSSPEYDNVVQYDRGDSAVISDGRNQDSSVIVEFKNIGGRRENSRHPIITVDKSKQYQVHEAIREVEQVNITMETPGRGLSPRRGPIVTAPTPGSYGSQLKKSVQYQRKV